MMTRKKKTVLFSEISDSGQLYATLGNALAHEKIDHALRVMRPVIEAQNGQVVKLLGSETMAVFESPSDAVQAAINLQKWTTESLNDVAEAFILRIGVHTGIAMVENDDVYGSVVHAAAHITSMATPGQILTTETVTTVLGDTWEDNLRPLGTHKLRGRREPIEVSEVLWNHLMTVIPDEATLIRPEGPTLTLRLGDTECIVDMDSKRCTIGRSSRNDLVIVDDHTSRVHAAIEYRAGQFIVTDYSTNGTYVRPETGEEIVLHREHTSLEDQGSIGLGRTPEKDPAFAISFELQN